MSIRIRTVIRKFLSWAEGALSQATVNAYRHQLTKFNRQVPNKVVCRLRPIDLTAWAKSWHEVQAIVRVCNWAVHDAKLIRINPLGRVRKPARGMRRRILTPQELARLCRRSRPAPRCFLLALRETMARPQEIRAASWDQLQADLPGMSIDDALASGHALIVQQEYKDCARRGDTSRPRVLLVSRRLGRLILRLGKTQTDRQGVIFKNSRGKAWTRNAVRCLLRRLRRRLQLASDARGENVTAYTVRHSLATWAAALGVVDRTLADLLGHVETRTTTRYLHLQVGHLRAAMARFTQDRRNARQNANRTL